MCPGSSQLSGQGSAQSTRAACISDKTHQTLGLTQQGLCIIWCCTSCGKLGLGPQGSQVCAEGAKGRSEGMMETGNSFVAVAAFVTISYSVSQVVKMMQECSTQSCSKLVQWLWGQGTSVRAPGGAARASPVQAGKGATDTLSGRVSQLKTISCQFSGLQERG